MRNKIEKAVIEIQNSWKNLTMESILRMKSNLEQLGQDQEVIRDLASQTRNHEHGLELFRDPSDGFILLGYSERQDTYRKPHDHGLAWVIYTVVSGEMEMRNYFKVMQLGGQFRLIQKNGERLLPGDTRIYFPGEIHDTRCATDHATILRFTSSDLKEEESLGRTWRHQD